MGDKSAISWTDATWNPVFGCSKVSPGCANCYAETFALTRMKGRPGYTGKPWVPENAAVNVQLRPHFLERPLHWKRPRRIFVNSLSDLFHERVPDAFIDQVFAVMALAPHHIFQVLTKRPDRMQEYLNYHEGGTFEPPHGRIDAIGAAVQAVAMATRRMPHEPGIDVLPERHARAKSWDDWDSQREYVLNAALGAWPLPNVWLGTSVENQHWADIRIPQLLKAPAAVRFLSCEPLLGPVDLGRVWLPDGDALGERLFSHGEGAGIDWVIVGGESGPKHRPMRADWAETIRIECVKAGVPFWFKQTGASLARELGLKQLKGDDPSEWPDQWRTQQWPIT